MSKNNQESSSSSSSSSSNPEFIISIPREVTSLFNGIEQLNESNWVTWKGHMKDNLELCDLWGIVCGNNTRPTEGKDIELWDKRERVARVIIKNALGTKDYHQIRHAKTATDIWSTLKANHENVGAQGKADLIWKFWNMRCVEGASVREHIGDLRALHSELAEMGIVIEDYLLAIAMSKSLPTSYDSTVSMIFAGLRNLDEADPGYISSKILEEEVRREYRNEEVNLATQKYCSNCKKAGHTKDQCYSKGGGKEGQGPRQIARRKKQESERLKAESSKKDSEFSAQEIIEDAFQASHMAVHEQQNINSIHFLNSFKSTNLWIADSGASSHIANNREMFTDFIPRKSTLNVAGGLTASVEGIGTVQMQSNFDGKLKFFKLLNVLYVPSTCHCLMSGSKLDQAGGESWYGNKTCKFINARGEIMVTGYLDGNLYKLKARAVLNENTITAYTVVSPVLSWSEAHRRLGHISLSSLKLLFNKRLVEGIVIDNQQPIPQALPCESCIAAKAHRPPFSLKATRHSKQFGDLTRSDVWGSPNITKTPGGNQYFILFIDDFTRYVTVKLMRDKASVKQKLMNYCNFVNTQYGRWPKEFRADNAAEFEGTRAWMEERGIELKTSAPYSPQQNGVAERMNRTILDLARAMRFEKSLPETLWGETVLHAAWIRIRSPTTALNGESPLKILTGNRPNLASTREFGEEVFILEELNHSKIQPKTRKAIFTGFEDGPKAIRYYDLETKKIRVSRNYYFKPDPLVVRRREMIEIPTLEPGTLKNTENQQSYDQTTESKLNSKSTVDLSTSNETNTEKSIHATEPIQNNSDSKRELRSMTETGTSTRKDYRELAGFNPRKYIRKVGENTSNWVNSNPSLSGNYYVNSPQFASLAQMLMDENSNFEMPNTIQEARKSAENKDWEKAIQTELGTLQEKETWKLVNPPEDANIIGNRWVFTKKYDENGKISRFKARLVAQGFTQGFVHDYSDTFSPVVRFDSFRLVIAIAAYHGYEIGQMDIKGAYLNGKLNETIYMRQPKGCEDGTGRVCKLQHTLYGLKQSGREWNKTLNEFLTKSENFVSLEKEKGLYVRRDIKGLDIIAVWVDDLFIVSTSKGRLEETKNKIKRKWEATDQGEPRLLLGIQLERDIVNNSIKIYQKQYILKILRRFDMENCTPVSTPLPPSAVYTPSPDEESFEDTTKYRAAIGSLMFAAIATRPDISYATNLMAQFNASPSQKHWNGVKHIFRYLKGTIDKGLLYAKSRHFEKDFTLSAYSDADNGKGYDRKSISGSVIVISGGAVKWTAEKQKLITVSTAESEYVAANLTGRNSLFLRDVMEELGFEHKDPIPLFMDSEGAIALTKNPENMRATLHIDKIYHWIRRHVEQGTFSPESIPSQENPADLFTKSLPKSTFDKHSQNIGLI